MLLNVASRTVGRFDTTMGSLKKVSAAEWILKSAALTQGFALENPATKPRPTLLAG
jgi:hypothetical protein